MNDHTASSQLPAPALPRENFRKIRECKDLGELFTSAEFRERIVASVPRHMTSDRILSVVLRAHMTNPLLLQATPMSFAGACLTATNTGLEPNSALQEAHLIPFKMKDRKTGKEVIQIQVIFGFQGLLKLANNTGRLLSISANVVYPSDVFDWMEGSNTFLQYKRGGRRVRTEQDHPEYAFFHARLTGGGESMEVWPYADVLRIRNLSQAYRRALRAKQEAETNNRRPPLTWTEAPWVRWEEAMARKTMVRAGVKYLPKSVELANAARLDEMQDKRDIDYSKVIDLAGNAEEPDYTGAAAQIGEQVEDDPEYIPNGGEGRAPDAAFVDRRTSQRNPTGGTDRQQARTDEERTVNVPSFEHFLIDEVGDHAEEPFLDPVLWAKGFIDLWQRCSAAARPMLIENNDEALADARQFPIADQLLTVTDAEAELPADPPLIGIAQDRSGRLDWKGYAQAFRTSLFGWHSDLEPWLDTQRARMTEAPLATRLLLLKACRERAEQVKTELPEWVIGLAGPAKPPADMAGRPSTGAPSGSDERWAGDTIEHINTLATAQDVNDYAAAGAVQAVMRRLRRENPALFDRVDNAVANRLAELGEGGPPDQAA